MVIGKDFAWGHLGKTGGDATWTLFQCVPDLVEFAHDPDVPEKHLAFRKMGQTTKRLVLNIRRLPSVTLSFVHHAYAHGITKWSPAGRRMTPDEAIAARRPERELTGMLRPDLVVSRWLRMEHLREDFLDFVSSLRPLTAAERDAIRRTPTKAPAAYDHAVERFFSEEQIVELYRSSPRWAAAELEVYGDIPVPMDVVTRETRGLRA